MGKARKIKLYLAVPMNTFAYQIVKSIWGLVSKY